jgi:hypothetical protein
MMLPMGRRLTDMLKARLAEDIVLGSEWLWPSPTSARGHVVEPKEKRRADVPSSHEYRHLARTLFIASGAPYAESALLLGQKLPGASGGYIHPEHLIEHLRPFMQALEDRVFAARTERLLQPTSGQGVPEIPRYWYETDTSGRRTDVCSRG